MSDDLGSVLGYTKSRSSSAEADLGAALGYSSPAPAPGTDRANRKEQREASRDRIESSAETAFAKPVVTPDPNRSDVRSGFIGGAVRGVRNILDSGAQMLVRGANTIGLVSDDEVKRVEDINRNARQDYEDNWKPTTSGRVGEFVGSAAPLVALTGGTSLPAVLGSGALGSVLARPDLRTDMSNSEYFTGKAEDAVIGAGTAGLLKVATAAAPVAARFAGRRAVNVVEGALSPTAHTTAAIGWTMSGNPIMTAVHAGAAGVLSRPTVRALSERLTQRMSSALDSTAPATRVDLLNYGAPSTVATVVNAAKGVASSAMPVAAGVAAGDAQERQAVPTVDEAQPGQPSQPSLLSEDLGASLGYVSTSKNSAKPQAPVDLGSELGYSKTTQATTPSAKAPTGYLSKVSKVESGGNPNAKNPNSSASGTYQFTDGTWRQVVAKYGDREGVSVSMKNDPVAQQRMMRYLTRDNEASLQSNQVPINDATRYLSHFLGSGGAKKFFDAPADQLAAAVLPDAAKSNKTVFYHSNGQPKTVREVYGWAEKKMA